MRRFNLAGQRLASLDAFRGITIAGMILVNNPGSSDYVYAPLRHAVWHGWTPTDLVFPFFPINKQIWTSTFVLFTAGAALLLLALCVLLIDGLGFKKWATPFFIFVTNAIAAYVGSIPVTKFLMLTKVSSYIHQHVFVPWAGNLNGSLAYAATYVLIWLALMTPLYKKKIFIKI